MRGLGALLISILVILARVDSKKEEALLANMKYKGILPPSNATCPFYKSETGGRSRLGVHHDLAPSPTSLLQDVLCYLYSEMAAEVQEYHTSLAEVGKTLSEFCQIAPTSIDDDPTYPRCLICHIFVRQLRSALRNPFKQFLMIRFLRRACILFAHRWGIKRCKRTVSEYAPIIFSAFRTSLKVVDLCHKMEICDGLCLMELEA